MKNPKRNKKFKALLAEMSQVEEAESEDKECRQ